jgi:hypothetical protein
MSCLQQPLLKGQKPIGPESVVCVAQPALTFRRVAILFRTHMRGERKVKIISILTLPQ